MSRDILDQLVRAPEWSGHGIFGERGLARRRVMARQRLGYRSMATVRFVGMPPGLSSPGDESAGPAESSDQAASVGWAESAPRDLPLRPVGHRRSVRQIRHLDDPEILERVLEGLINLV